MRICLVSQAYPPETAGGGIATQTYNKAHGLAALGHEMHVITRSRSGQKTVAQTGKVSVIRIPSPTERIPIHTEVADWITYSAEVAVALAELDREVKLDLVDFPEWACEGYVHLLNRTEWSRVPTVVQLHGPLVMFSHTMGWPELDTEFYRTGTALESTCLRLADRVYSSSSCSANWCATHYHLPVKRIPVIHTGIDTALFSPRPVRKADRPTIIFVGKITPNKGVFELFDAASALAKDFPTLQLRVIGEGAEPEVEILRSKAARTVPESLLDMAGFVAHEELPEHLSRAHVFAAPSVYEGGPGFVYLEAMACGLPVIACAGSGASEVVSPEQTGLLVPPNDPPALVMALHRLLTDAREREAMGLRARQYVVEHADSAVCLKRLESFYAATAASEARPAK